MLASTVELGFGGSGGFVFRSPSLRTSPSSGDRRSIFEGRIIAFGSFLGGGPKLDGSRREEIGRTLAEECPELLESLLTHPA